MVIQWHARLKWAWQLVRLDLQHEISEKRHPDFAAYVAPCFKDTASSDLYLIVVTDRPNGTTFLLHAVSSTGWAWRLSNWTIVKHCFIG